MGTICKYCGEMVDGLADLADPLLAHIAHRQDQILNILTTEGAQMSDISAQQTELNADVAALADAFTSLSADFAAEVAALQAAQEADQPLDLSGLEAVLAQFQGLAASAAPPAASSSAAPTDPAPADPTPAAPADPTSTSSDVTLGATPPGVA